ncbi:hypothetical protein C8Q72DRAFT_886324 [Fomitopsis betulina]|nr:hypothetical protein C8Q72DRAFT_886324 [Fomitopsis betulina]
MSAPAEATAALHEIVKSTLGALMIGMFFSSTFFGITLLQTYQYYDKYWSDAWWLKSFVRAFYPRPLLHPLTYADVFIARVLDALQLVTVVHSNWWYLIENYANPGSLKLVPWSLGLETGLTSSIGFLVQTFFAMRVYILSRGNGWMTALIWASTAALACSIAGDVLITLSMCYYLYLGRSGHATSDRMIHTLMKYTVNTGLLTTVSAICTIALSETHSTTYWDTIFYFVVSKCYVNSTLATLNAREKLRDRSYRPDTSGVTTGTGFRASISLAPANPVGSAWSANTEDSTASRFSGTAVGSRHSVYEGEGDKDKHRNTYLVA